MESIVLAGRLGIRLQSIIKTKANYIEMDIISAARRIINLSAQVE